MSTNPVTYFEIPVTDIGRATAFYEAVFLVTLQATNIDGHQMALFPSHENGQGASGALAKGDSYVPSNAGPRIYFYVESISSTLEKVIQQGGQLAYPKNASERIVGCWIYLQRRQSDCLVIRKPVT